MIVLLSSGRRPTLPKRDRRRKRSSWSTLRSVTDLEVLARALAALGHETRLRILVLLRDGSTLSPREATERLSGDKLGKVAYHFRMLRDAGLITETRIAPVRGALQHFYVLSDRGRELLDDLKL
jgi:DNA-binding transcriptional ArsR family regulator